MFKKKASLTQVCNRCGKQLEYRTCKVCDGKGYHRKLVFFKEDCKVCSGSGKVLRCPDKGQHKSKEVGLKHSSNSNLKDFPKIDLPKPPTPKVIPPWFQINNPKNPNSLNNPNNPINRLKQQRKFWR
jgi:hypothetical protein